MIARRFLLVGLLVAAAGCPRPHETEPPSSEGVASQSTSFYRGVAVVEGHGPRPGYTTEVPVQILAASVDALQAQAQRWLSATAASACTPIAGATICRESCTQSECVAVHADGDRVRRLERRFTHERLGDVADTVSFPPGGLVVKLFQLDHAVEFIVHRDDDALDIDATDLSGALDPRATEGEAVALAPLELEWLEPAHVGRVRIESQELAVPFVVGPRGIVMFEAPLSSRLTERIVALVEVEGGAPVVGAVLTHHHPHHAGGVRALVARGIQIYGTDAVERVTREAIIQSRTFVPDSLAQAPRELLFERVTGEASIDLGGEVQVRLVEIGRESQHTDEHLVASALGWIVLGDLYPPSSAISEAAEQRRKGISSALRGRGIEGHVTQVWPLGPPFELAGE